MHRISEGHCPHRPRDDPNPSVALGLLRNQAFQEGWEQVLQGGGPHSHNSHTFHPQEV